MSDEARGSESVAQKGGVVTDQAAQHGVRTDTAPQEIRSRSADPGQSSYGGFRNEDPGMQHQADASQAPATGYGARGSQASGGPPDAADHDLQDRVCERLWRSGLDVSEVSVQVVAGFVSLEGVIGSREARRALEECVDAIPRVHDIANRVRVRRDETRLRG